MISDSVANIFNYHILLFLFGFFLFCFESSFLVVFLLFTQNSPPYHLQNAHNCKLQIILCDQDLINIFTVNSVSSRDGCD